MNVLGLYDVAGNAKEWCWNEAGVNTGTRFILGGGFSDPNYLFNDADAQSAFARGDSFGFRLVKYLDDAPLSAAVTNPASAWKRDYSKEKPVSEETFNQYARFYTYDKTPLDAVVEYSRDEQYWRKEKVVYNAAYNHERIPAFLFLPKSASPPFQTLVYYPGSGAQNETNNDNIEFDRVVVLVDSATLRGAEQLIEFCEYCMDECAEIPFDNLLDRIIGSDPSVTDYSLETPAKCRQVI